MMRLLLGLGLSTTLAVSPAFAQQNALVGTWEIVGSRNSGGQLQPRNGLMIMTADGHFAMMQTAKNRPKSDKELSAMTRHELLQRMDGLNVRGGTYSVSGNRVTRHITADGSPSRENTDDVLIWKVDGDTLTLTSSDKREFTWRRARSAGNGTR